MGKLVVAAADVPVFVVNRCNRPFGLEALRLVQDGVATPEQVDRICRMAGHFRMGPFELMDLTGMDVNYPVSRIVFEAFQSDPRLKTTAYHKLLVDGGRLGRKSGVGHYHYDERGRMVDAPDPDFAPAAEPAEAAFMPDAGPGGLLKPAGIKVLEDDDGAAPIVMAPLGEDATACAALQSLFPTRRVVGLDCRDVIWGLGAWHCLTQQVPAV